MSLTNRTATAMLEVIGENGGEPVLSADMERELVARVGTSKYLHEAAAHLREHGVLLVAQKARQHSNWRVIDPAVDDTSYVEKWNERVRRESLSEMAHEAQAMASSAGNPGIRRSRDRVVANAITLGADLGMSAPEVLAMCEPRSAAQA